mmetsp:Transcript_18177/g.58063  ORF Transcript_18177/g.58063 Transcript_18177/m.58063 type:complete len:285 (-) Transcript_18177:281-1135(-)
MSLSWSLTIDLTAESFASWLNTVFFQELPRARPQVLLMDNDSAHKGEVVMDKLDAEGVSLVLLPPHTSDILQPLDICFNHALKSRIHSRMDNLINEQELERIPLETMIHIIATAYNETIHAVTLRDGFRKAGLYPFNRAVVKPALAQLPDELRPREPARGEEREQVLNKVLHPPAAAAQDLKETLVRRRDTGRQATELKAMKREERDQRKREREILAAEKKRASEARAMERARVQAEHLVHRSSRAAVSSRPAPFRRPRLGTKEGRLPQSDVARSQRSPTPTLR